MRFSIDNHPIAAITQWMLFPFAIISCCPAVAIQDQCGSGGTGRHTILRGWRRKAWGFKSPLPHHRYPGNPSESSFRYKFADRIQETRNL